MTALLLLAQCHNQWVAPVGWASFFAGCVLVVWILAVTINSDARHQRDHQYRMKQEESEIEKLRIQDGWVKQP